MKEETRFATIDEIWPEVLGAYQTKDYQLALHLSVEARRTFPESESRMLWPIACFQSLLQRPDDAIRTLEEALALGLWWNPELFQVESDFDPIRSDPRFQRIVQQNGALLAEARKTPAELKWRVFPPAGNMPSRPPMILWTHGRGQGLADIPTQIEAVAKTGVQVAVIQSREVFDRSSYSWDGPVLAVETLRAALREVGRSHPYDPERLILAGFSQGGGLALYAAVQALVSSAGVVGVCPGGDPYLGTRRLWREGPPHTTLRPWVHFVSGENDSGLPVLREVCEELAGDSCPATLDVVQELAHEYPEDLAERVIEILRDHRLF